VAGMCEGWESFLSSVQLSYVTLSKWPALSDLPSSVAMQRSQLSLLPPSPALQAGDF
jgi:hypothetical protein